MQCLLGYPRKKKTLKIYQFTSHKIVVEIESSSLIQLVDVNKHGYEYIAVKTLQEPTPLQYFQYFSIQSEILYRN